jgi:hypothetical protein
VVNRLVSGWICGLRMSGIEEEGEDDGPSSPIVPIQSLDSEGGGIRRRARFMVRS